MSTTQWKQARPQELAGSTMYGIYVASVAACLAGNLAVRLAERGEWLPPWARVALAALSAIPLFVAAVLFWRMLRRNLDEMLQRIVLEGLAFALAARRRRPGPRRRVRSLPLRGAGPVARG